MANYSPKHFIVWVMGRYPFSNYYDATKKFKLL